ncbi:MAG: DUF5081 family protein [Lachnospiraceae bacterium]|nr:DUF5081 family protein [Lachnospiraceae bacterium]
MTLKEIYVLNDILDRQDIYSLPSFSSLNMTEELLNVAKDSLIKKKLLKNRDEFMEKGALITKMLMEYKKAKKYIQILSLSIGILDNEKAVMISQLDEDDYDFTVIDIKKSTTQFLEVFTFLNKAKSSKTLTEIKIPPEKLKEEYRYNEFFSLKTEDEKNRTDEICFLANNQLYIYDYRKDTLYPTSYGDAVKLIIERLAYNE